MFSKAYTIGRYMYLDLRIHIIFLLQTHTHTYDVNAMLDFEIEIPQNL